MNKACSRWLAIEKAQGDRVIQGFSYKRGSRPEKSLRSLRGTRVYECRYRIGDARNLNENKKGDFRVRGEEAALIRPSLQVDRGFMYSWGGVLGTTRSGCTPVETDRVLVSRVHRGPRLPPRWLHQARP